MEGRMDGGMEGKKDGEGKADVFCHNSVVDTVMKTQVWWLQTVRCDVERDRYRGN